MGNRLPICLPPARPSSENGRIQDGGAGTHARSSAHAASGPATSELSPAKATSQLSLAKVRPPQACGVTMSSGFTCASNCSGVTSPEATAASRSVTFFSYALFAIFAAAS